VGILTTGQLAGERERLSPRICHELNNLLTAILGNAELALMETEPSSSVYRSLDHIYKSAERAAQLLGNPPTQNPEFAPRQNPPRSILIADSDEAIRESAQRLLEHAGYRVVLAKTGEETVDALRTHADRIAVLVLDPALPGADGLDLLRQAHSTQPGIKMFVWSTQRPSSLDEMINSLADIEYVDRPSQSHGIAKILSRIVEPLLEN